MRKAQAIGVRAALVCAFVVSFALISKGQQGEVVPARVTQAVDPENRVTLRGNTHPLARPDFDQGAAPDSQATERLLLVLKRSTEQETALRKLLDAQQTKSSANYHMWLTPEQFGQQFGPADSDIQAVTNWLTSQGFQVNRVAAGRTVIEFSGTAGTVLQALHTQIHRYEVNGKEHWANASDPQIPAALTPVVAGFASLNNFPRKPMHHGLAAYTKSTSTGQVKPSLTVTSGGVTYYALGPADFATIYNVPNWSSFTGGTGQTIAVVGETNINPQDVDDFRTLFGIKPQSLPANAPCPAVSTTHPIPIGICVNGPDPGIIPPAISEDESEADLDVEWSGAVAPAATIAFVVSETTEVTAGIDLSALYIIDNNLAPVMTESYGGCEAALGNGGNAFYYTLWEQGAAEGITILEAAGDEGSAACDIFASTGVGAAQYGLNVVGNASTPFNVAVGGTDFNDVSTWSTYWSSANNSTTLSSAMSYIPEMAWNDTCANSGSVNGCSSGVSDTGSDLSGGGGGESNCSSSTTITTVGGTETQCVSGNPKPSWQSGTGVPNDQERDLPDVSLYAGDGYTNSFYVLCEADSLPAGTSSCVESNGSANFMGAGGTSASVQAFGGIMALVNQKYGSQGVANYVLYPLAAKTGASCASTAAMAPKASSSSCVFYDTQTGNNSVACVADSPNCSDQTVTGTGYGILVNNANQAAWTTNAGFDLATGLGTVNAANLVSQWNTVSFTPTTTTLTLTAPAGYKLTNIPHGQPVSIAVSVSPSASTGDVSLLGGPAGYNPSCASTPCNLGIDFATLTGGSVSGTTTMLPGGTYNVTARYAGDGTHAASTSSPVPVTVAAENSNTFLVLAEEDCSGNVTYVTSGTFVYGNTISCSGVFYSQYWLVMNVTNGTGSLNAADPYGVAGACFESPAYQCPNGQVTVLLNGSKMPPTTDVGAPSSYNGTYNLNSQGTAEDQFIQLPVGTTGTDSLVATYEPSPDSPNNSYNTSTSNPVGVSITKATTVTSVTATPSNVASGATVSLSATVNTSSLGLAPAGSVGFFNGNSQISGTPAYTYVPGSLAGPASLTATLSTSFTANASITAQYSGDVNYGNSTSAAATVTITANPDFGLAASPTSFTITSPGQSGSTTVSASAVNGFSGTVSIVCALPASLTYSTCTLSTATLTPGGTGAQLTLATTAPSAAFRLPDRPRWFLPGAGLLLIAWILLLLAAGKHRRVKLAFGLLVFAMLATAFVACGGGGGSTGPGQGNPGTPTGSYTITVTGTSTVSGASVSHTLNIPVSVQ
ncbi:MAG: protease pro-enzyme activation domain-containing protein [Terriglobia bacterium]|jgi:hypothetical protein